MRLIRKKYRFYLIIIAFLLICGQAFGEQEENELFPLYGVTLGKTTTAEMAQLGRKSDQYSYYIINSLNFYYHKDIAFIVSINKNESMPENWSKLGFNWDLSYDQWMVLLRSQNFKVRIRQFPVIQIYRYKLIETYNPYQTFEAEFEAFKNSQYPTVLRFSFNFGKGTKSSDQNSLYGIKATYSPKTKDLLEQDYVLNDETITLSESQRKAIALSGILSEQNKGYHERLETFNFNNPNVIQTCKELLLRDWGIKNREDLLDNLDALDNNKGHSKSYEDIMKIIDENQGLSEEEIAIKYNYRDEIIKRLFFVKKMRSVIGERTLRAWDYGRSVYLCRDGYLIGFLTEKEAWDRIDKTAKKVNELYLSWEDFGANYIAGRMFWATWYNEAIEKGNEALEAYSKLIYTKDSAWNLPWGDGKKRKNSGLQPTTIEDALYCPSKEHKAWELFTEGRKLYQGKLYEKAIAEFNNALRLNPNSYYATLYRGHANYENGDYRKAISDYQRLIKIKANDIYAHQYLGQSYEKNNQLNEALQNYERMITVDPFNPEGYIALGRFYYGQKRFQDTIFVMEKAEKLLIENQDKNNSQRNNSLNYVSFLLGACHYNYHFYDLALPYFLRGYEGYKNWGDIHYYIGICYLNKKDPEKDQAVEYFKKAAILGYKLPPEIQDSVY